MATTPKRLTIEQLERINRVSADRSDKVLRILQKAAFIAGDGDKERRLSMRQCLACHHTGGGLAGQAFTRWTCRLCGTEDQHGNTATPKLCVACADAFGLCVDCGGDVSMQHRTRKFGQRAKKRSKAEVGT